MTIIKEIPVLERPRERLVNYGVDNLSNEELLSIILKTGIKNISVKELSINVLKEIDCFLDLKNITYEKLITINGIGVAKACELLASIELGKRLNYKYDSVKKINIKCANSIFDYYKMILNDKKQEYFYCLYLDVKNNVIKDKLLFIGTINQSLVHPREIFKEAYLVSASSIICVHNHPSGSIKPSKNDIEITKQLCEAAQLLGINFLDHIIIGGYDYYSFMENGIMLRK